MDLVTAGKVISLSGGERSPLVVAALAQCGLVMPGLRQGLEQAGDEEEGGEAATGGEPFPGE